MNLNQEQNTVGNLSLPMCQRVINTDVSEDFTLPDYNSEIRRVLCVRETLPTPSKFISGGKLDVNGVIDYTLVYISNEGKLSSAPLSTEYSFSLPLENVSDFDMNEGINVMIHSIAEASNVRVSAPRKLQIRSRIRSCVNVWGKKPMFECSDENAKTNCLQFLTKSVACADIICENSDTVSLSDEYIMSDENCRVAFAESSVQIKDCTADGEVLRARGEVLIKMLVMCDNEQKCEKVIRKMPFEAESDLDGIEADGECLCRAGGTLSDLSLNVEENKVNIEANLLLEICMGKNLDVEYTRDMYSTEQITDVNIREESVPCIIKNENITFLQNGKIPNDELDFSDDAEIIDVCASACVNNVILDEDKYILQGNCKYNIICQSVGEYVNREAILPFEFEIEGNREIDNFDAVVDVISANAKNNKENLELEAELCIGCTLFGEEKIEMVDSVSFFGDRELQNGEWTVCYIKDNESIWDIAKKHAVAPQSIKGDPESESFVLIER